MSQTPRKSTEQDGLDYLYHTARRIHRLADAAVPVGPNPRTPAQAQDDSPPHATAAQKLVAGVAERFAAGMIARFGGRPMVDSIGRWVDYAGRKRRSAS